MIVEVLVPVFDCVECEKIRNRHLTDTKLKRGRLEALKLVERVKGIEPSLSAWETEIRSAVDPKP